jgi:hypothetical protein
MAGASGLAGSFRLAGGYRDQTMDVGNNEDTVLTEEPRPTP